MKGSRTQRLLGYMKTHCSRLNLKQNLFNSRFRYTTGVPHFFIKSWNGWEQSSRWPVPVSKPDNLFPFFPPDQVNSGFPPGWVSLFLGRENKRTGMHLINLISIVMRAGARINSSNNVTTVLFWNRPRFVHNSTRLCHRGLLCLCYSCSNNHFCFFDLFSGHLNSDF